MLSIQQVQPTPPQVPTVRVFRSGSTQVCIGRSLPESLPNQQLAAPPMKLLSGECGIAALSMPGLVACWSRPTLRYTAGI